VGGTERRADSRGGGGAGVPVAGVVGFGLVRGEPDAAGAGVAGVRGAGGAGEFAGQTREGVRGEAVRGRAGMELEFRLVENCPPRSSVVPSAPCVPFWFRPDHNSCKGRGTGFAFSHVHHGDYRAGAQSSREVAGTPGLAITGEHRRAPAIPGGCNLGA